MAAVQQINSQVSQYLILSDQIKARYSDIDEETLRDTLEGISDLPDLIKEVVRSSLEDEAMVIGLKTRISDMQARVDRIKSRSEKKRQIACWAMQATSIDRLIAEDFSASLRHGPPRVEILDEDKIPNEFLIPAPPRIDRAAMLYRLKQGVTVTGAILADGQPHLSVRVK